MEKNAPCNDDDEIDGWISLKALTLNVVWFLLEAREENQKEGDGEKERAEKCDKQPKQNPCCDFLETARTEIGLLDMNRPGRKRVDVR